MYGMDVEIKVYSPGKLPEKTNRQRMEERALLRSIRKKDEKGEEGGS